MLYSIALISSPCILFIIKWIINNHLIERTCQLVTQGKVPAPYMCRYLVQAVCLLRLMLAGPGHSSFTRPSPARVLTSRQPGHGAKMPADDRLPMRPLQLSRALPGGPCLHTRTIHRYHVVLQRLELLLYRILCKQTTNIDWWTPRWLIFCNPLASGSGNFLTIVVLNDTLWADNSWNILPPSGR